MHLSAFAICRQQPIVVAIPVKNEAERIAACLQALARQTRLPDVVVLLLNNCSDATEAVVAAMAPVLPYRLLAPVRTLEPPLATAGHARRLAMALAAEHAGRNGTLLATDADATPRPDWIACNMEALRQGADIVCGQAVINAREGRLIPRQLHLDIALERELDWLLDGLAWSLDPEMHDPPPRHTEASGASLAMSAAAFHAVGGIPDVPCGEDRAMVRAMWLRDMKVRHDPGISVIVSGRVLGQAEGGMADTIRRRMIRQDEFTDDRLEPARDAGRRYALRRRARSAWAGHADPGLAADLAVPAEALRDVLRHPFFGAAWATLERISPALARRRVRFADLAAEIALARGLLPADALAAD